jgi:Phosphotransferase enzyme family
MHHEPFASLDELLSPETLSRLAGCSIVSVRRLPFVGGSSASGSRFLAIETNDGQGPRFVVKRSSPGYDWIVRGTADCRGREVLVWETGLLDRLPPEISHPVIACARHREGWAILMHDVSDQLLPDPMGVSPVSEADHLRYLDALAALHADFWGRSEIVDPALGYCRPWHRYTVFSPATGARETAHSNEAIRWIQKGWPSFLALIAPDVAALLSRLLADPTPLCAAMARYPQTVVHGDPRPANLGIVPGPRQRVVLIDWHFVGPGVPAVDLIWYLSTIGPKAPVSNETTIAWYRERLAQRLGSRFEEQWWFPQLELSLLGEMVRRGFGIGWRAAHHPDATLREWARQSVGWWSGRAREGARWL